MSTMLWVMAEKNPFKSSRKLPGFFFVNSVHSIHEVPYDRELAKDKQSIGKV